MKIDHQYTTLIVCPYCGHKDIDSWERTTELKENGEQLYECGSCGEEFYAQVDIEVTFTTYKKGD